MYKISQFSKISGLTVKALRYYDNENILKPSFRSEENQYRYYSEDDLKKALFIKYLRSLEFSMIEIKEVLDSVESEEDLNYILQEKIKNIKANISKEKELIQKISTGIISYDTCTADNQYPVDIVDIKETFVACIKFTGKYSDLDKYIPILYQVVKSNKSGKHFNCYFNEDYTENADIELCIPVKKLISDKTVSCKILPGMKALHTTHHGNYDTLYLAYKTMIDYANAHNIKIIMPSREVYVKSPGMIFRGNPANYITEILLPFEVDGKDML